MPAIELTSVMQHEIIATFSAGLAQAFVEHVDDLWPGGEPSATTEGIRSHVDDILGLLEQAFHIGPDGRAASLLRVPRRLHRLLWRLAEVCSTTGND